MPESPTSAPGPSTTITTTTTTTTSSSSSSSSSSSCFSSANNGTPAAKTTSSPTTSPSPFTAHALRRSVAVVDEAAQVRRRSGGLASFVAPASNGGGSNYSYAFMDEPRRRSSTFSEYSLNEARRGLQNDILNPGGRNGLGSHSSNWASVPLAFALLPAVGGILFKDGSVIITDVMLLGLAAIFLHWSVTQPWIWYHSAQEVRVREERIAELVIDDDSEPDEPGPPSTPDQPISKIDPDATTAAAKEQEGRVRTRTRQAQNALGELYMHEVLALILCFGFPALGAFLLHSIRGQLSRPRDGLVSNYNVTIFLLAAEIHPLSHLIKLVQARTLHLQRIVHANPLAAEVPALVQLQEMAKRIEDLEARAVNEELAAATVAATAATNSARVSPNSNHNGPQNGHVDRAKQAKLEAALSRDVRNAIQPELDALNRAVRRYEKKATVLACQTEARLNSLHTRLDDAIALAAVAAKNSAASQWTLVGCVVDALIQAVVLPVQAVAGPVMWSFKVGAGLFSRGGGKRNGGSRNHHNHGAGAGLRERERERERRHSRLGMGASSSRLNPPPDRGVSKLIKR